MAICLCVDAAARWQVWETGNKRTDASCLLPCGEALLRPLQQGQRASWQDRSCFWFMHSHSSSFLHSIHWCSRKQRLVLILHVKSRGMFLPIPKRDAKKYSGLLGTSAPRLGIPKWLDCSTRKHSLEQGTLKVSAWGWGQPINTLQHHFI